MNYITIISISKRPTCFSFCYGSQIGTLNKQLQVHEDDFAQYGRIHFLQTDKDNDLKNYSLRACGQVQGVSANITSLQLHHVMHAVYFLALSHLRLPGQKSSQHVYFPVHHSCFKFSSKPCTSTESGGSQYVNYR